MYGHAGRTVVMAIVAEPHVDGQAAEGAVAAMVATASKDGKGSVAW